MGKEDELPTREELWAGINALLGGQGLPRPADELNSSLLEQTGQEKMDISDDEYDRDPKNEITDRLMIRIFRGIPTSQIDPRSAVGHLIENLELFKKVLIKDIKEKGGPNISQQEAIINEITLRDLANHTKIQSERYNLKVGRMEWNSKEQEEELRNRSDYYNKWLEVTEIAAHESEH